MFIVRSLAAALFATAFVAAPASAEPGGVPEAAKAKAAPAASATDSTSGLKTIYRKFGKLRASVDGAGGAVTNDLRVNKPVSNAKVAKAYLFTSTHGADSLPNRAVSVENGPVTWMARQNNVFDFYIAGAADVTSLVKAKIDAAPAGNLLIKVKEKAGVLGLGEFDGHILAVVFSTPSDPSPRSIVLQFGGAVTTGDAFGLTLAAPIDPNAPIARAQMGLGIAGSFQQNGAQQYTIVDVNGRRLTTSAGGEDDGAPFDHGLITVGGVGDVSGNPPRNALPANARSDDELYNLLPFLSATTKAIEVRTSNPSENDNLFFAWFDLTAQTKDNADTDGDGLLDVWETSGYDHDGDGTIDVDLPALGADPNKKDIFIAYAWMVAGPGESLSHKPSSQVLNAVAQAFARAPVDNPDGTKGVVVHFRNLGGVPHDNDLNPVWPEFDAIMNPKLSAAEERIFRRMLNAHGYGGGGSSGIARDIPASDFVESLGQFSTNPGTFAQRAGTIMHELGHTLGLRHGGVDHENYKPNHLSVMSYANQFDWLLRDGAPFLDYERFDLGDLDENNLNEAVGLNAAGAEALLARYGVRWVNPSFFLSEKTSGANVNVDWNANGAIETSVATNVNNVSSRTVLRAGFPEWANVIYDGGLIGARTRLDVRRSLVSQPDDLKELSEEDYLELKRRR